MSASKNLIQAAAGVGGGDFYSYTVDYSARFNDNDSAYLYRTPSSAGSQDATTISVWVKRGNQGIYSSIFWQGNSADGNHNNSTYAYWNTDNSIQFMSETSGSTIGRVETTPLYRDSSGWYHLVFVYDSANATANDRMRIYVNGERVTALDINTMPSQNADSQFNRTDRILRLGGSAGSATGYFADCYFSQYVLVDGTALDPTSFGQFKNGVWIPKNVSGLTFGTNGFYLDFADSSALGNDVSGNNNDFTSSGLTSSDQMPDTPTNNYPTLQATFSTSATTYSNGNLEAQQDSGAYKHTRATFGLPTTGKWYWEVQFIDARVSDPPSTAFGIGVSDNDGIGDQGYSTGAVFSIVPGSTTTYTYEDNAYTPADNITLSNAVVDGDWFGIAYDADTRKMWLWSERDNTWLASGDPANGTNPWKTLTALSAGQTYFPIALTSTNDSGRWSKIGVNFGQYAFVGSAPTDFLELKAANLPEPTIGPNSATLSDENFNTVLWTGTGATNNITGVGFQPDLTWIKQRDTSQNNVLHDAVRGAGKYIMSDSTNAEATNTNQLSSFDTDGFTVGTASSTNQSGSTFVGWNWKANGSGVSNTDGSITSTVSANQDAGISIIKYSGGSSANQTIGHGLGVKPKMVILKNISITYDWYVFSEDILGLNNGLDLNTVDALNTTWSGYKLADTSSVISFGTYWEGTGYSGYDYLALAFAEVEGFSKFGKYTGNGSTNGPFVYTGFRPAWVMVKNISGTAHWIIYDNNRDIFNVAGRRLGANLADSENQDNINLGTDTSVGIDLLSNGFKLRVTGPNHNTSGSSYIYMAFAENPFKYSNAR